MSSHIGVEPCIMFLSLDLILRAHVCAEPSVLFLIKDNRYVVGVFFVFLNFHVEILKFCFLSNAVIDVD